MTRAEKRALRSVEDIAFDVRCDYYGGKLDWDEAVSALRNLFCEFTDGNAETRRLEATVVAIKYLEPDV